MKIYKSVILSFLIIIPFMLKAQEVEKNLDDAKSSYKSGELEDARFALQQALGQIDVIIGNKVLEVLPVNMGGLDADTPKDQVTGNTAGYVGLFVQRQYGVEGGEKSGEIEIISDSPLLTGINAILAMPQIAGMSDPNQRRIKIDGYKALMQKNVDDEGNVTSYDVQVPFSNSLLTFSCEGIESEGDVISMASTIPMSKIVEITK